MPIKLSYAFARASAWTFTIPPIYNLVHRYVDPDDYGKGWIDPFSGDARIAEYCNDMNPERNAPFQLEAVVFVRDILPYIKPETGYKGILFDPPYSHRQVSEHYKECGKKATSMDTSANFTIRVKRAANEILPIGSIAICCGWNTSGFGKVLGWEKIEILNVEHGLTHNNTLVTVEKKTSHGEKE